MTDTGHLGALAIAESRYSGPSKGGGGGFTWGRILLAVLLMVGIPTAIFLLARGGVYEGPVRWTHDYSGITLIDKGLTVAVTDSTDILLVDGRSWGLDELRNPLAPRMFTGVFRAKVSYRLSKRSSETSQVAGEARRITSLE